MKIMLAGTLVGKGGIQTHLQWLSKALVEEGAEILILSLGDKKPAAGDIELIDELQDQGIFVNLVTPQRHNNFPVVSRLQTAWSIRNIILGFKPDVYLVVGTGFNLLIPPLLIRQKMRRIFFEVMSGMRSSWFNPRCLVPWYSGTVTTKEKEQLWDRYYTVAPPRQRQCVEQSKVVKRA